VGVWVFVAGYCVQCCSLRAMWEALRKFPADPGLEYFVFISMRGSRLWGIGGKKVWVCASIIWGGCFLLAIEIESGSGRYWEAKKGDPLPQSISAGASASWFDEIHCVESGVESFLQVHKCGEDWVNSGPQCRCVDVWGTIQKEWLAPFSSCIAECLASWIERVKFSDYWVGQFQIIGVPA
jgi:hypothetical protein